MTASHEHEVAFSFAGEDRHYVEQVADQLRLASISIFYDKFEEVNLWGKDLYSHLDDVYQNKARYCVIFISKFYKKKVWTNHERKSAQAKAFNKNQEYILPARFDNTSIPGILPTTAYIDLQKYTPKEFADLIKQKLGYSDSVKRSAPKVVDRGFKNETQRAKSPSSSQKSSRVKTSKPTKDVKPSVLPRTKTVNFNKSGIENLPNDLPVVYKILTEGGSNNFTGAAKRGEVSKKIMEHLPEGRRYVPGSKIQIERMQSFMDAQEKVVRIVNRTKPKYN